MSEQDEKITQEMPKFRDLKVPNEEAEEAKAGAGKISQQDIHFQKF